MRSKIVRGTGVVALALSAVACGAEPGVPAPGTPIGQTTTAPATSTTVPTTTTSAKPREVLFNQDGLCALLPPAEAALFGAKNPRKTNSFVTGNPQCGWMGELAIVFEFSASGTYTPEPGATDIEVAGLPAFLVPVEEKNPICKVVVRLNEGRSSLSMGTSVLSAGEGKGYEPCEVAKQLAEIVIPKVKG